MKHALLTAYGATQADALDALAARLSGRWVARQPEPLGSASLAAGASAGRRERDPQEIARAAVEYQHAQSARGLTVPTWQAVDAVMRT